MKRHIWQRPVSASWFTHFYHDDDGQCLCGKIFSEEGVGVVRISTNPFFSFCTLILAFDDG